VLRVEPVVETGRHVRHLTVGGSQNAGRHKGHHYPRGRDGVDRAQR
jgi:hypothetical protein